MRNLKKLFAVVMVVAMLASMMVPALAAGVEYEDEATILQDLGLFQGYGAGELGLADDLTREQGLALMLRVMGLEDEVKAMTEEEVAAELARVVDPETVTATWAKPYVAYAVKNGLTKGIDASILPNVKFAGQLKMTGKEFINLMLNGMGYATAWDDVLTKAAEVEMLSAGESVTFGTVKEMTRDQAVAIMFGALSGITSEGITLAQALVDAGAVDADKMEEYGFIVPEVVPTEAPEEITAEASATNLVQLNVEFSTEVDKDSAEDKGNYDIDKVKIEDASLQDDGRTVVLTFAWKDARKQQDVIDLVIDGVKDLDGNKMDEFTIEDIEFIDTTIPTAIDAEVVGIDTIKVTFAEPMKSNYGENGLKKADFSVNSGKLYVKEVKLQKNNTEALVVLYNDLKEGELTIEVKSGSEDFAGFGVVPKSFTLEVVKDEEAPVVIGYEKASRSEITLIWNEDIEFNGKMDFRKDPAKDTDRELFYHTNSKNPVRVETVKDDGKIDNYAVKLDGNKTTLYFDDDTKLPNGTAYVYVMKEAVRDLWDNKNTQQMIQVEVEIDNTPPEVDKIDVKDEDKIEIKFTEDVDKDSAEDKDNYTILDKDGKEIEKIINKVTSSSKTVTMTFKEKLSGDYSIAIKNVEDKAGNKIASVTVDFNVGDKTPPNEEKFEATLYKAGDEDQMIRIFFDDVMETEGKYAVTDVENYVIIDSVTKKEIVKLEKIKEVEIEVVDDGKAVEIYIPSLKDVKDKIDKPENKKDYFDFTIDAAGKAEQWIQIARVADAAGNKLGVMTYDIELDVSTTIDIDKVEATARDTIEITFKDEIVGFESDDIEIYVDGEKLTDNDIAGVDTKVKDGKTTAVYTLDSKMLAPDLDGTAVEVKIIAKPESENRYGKTLTAGQSEDAADKIKPELFDDGNKDKDYAGEIYYGADAEDNTDRFVKDYFAIAAADELTVSDGVYYFTASLYLNEEVKIKDGVSASSAGADFIVKIDGKQIYNEVDYIVELKGKKDDVDAYELLFSFKAKEDKGTYKLEGDLEIELASKVNYIVDNNNNTLASFDTIEVEDINFYCEK